MTSGDRPRPGTYQVVLDHVERLLTSHELRPGDRLPPERELAAQLGASRQAVREAMRVLQTQGVIRSQVGTGDRSGTIVVPAPARALGRVLALHLALESFPVDDVIEARILLEGFAAGRAARRRTAKDLLRIHAELDAMEADLDPLAFSHADVAFHVAVAGTAGNRLVDELTVAIRESLRGRLLTAMTAPGDWAGLRERLRREHEGIYSAISDGRGSRAADLMEAHVRDFHEDFGSGPDAGS
ncbi:FCD domain-containing protein [Pseudonocardia ailaonensis]|uniref:FCD domain-containing protein n=1 Tax=Pseudonocardia ailaonensis TaxID=367279 RepID=A0ABN2MZG8_9PSEU